MLDAGMPAQDLLDQPEAGGAAYVLKDQRSFVSFNGI
jgi:hypothetical protein